MKVVSAFVALFFTTVIAQGFSINTPSNVVECEPTLLSWSGGTPPYYLSILPGATPSGTAIESFPAINSTSFTWICNIAANTYIGFTLRDNTGAIAQSAPFTITAGSSTSCTNVTSGVPGPTVASSASTSTGSAASAGTSAGATASSSASPSSSSSSSGASANVAQFGVAGVVGAAVAALFL